MKLLFSTTTTHTTKALVLVVLCVCLTQGDVTVIDANDPSQTPFFVQPYSTGFATYGNSQPFTSDQTQGIKEIQFCFSWLIPVQPLTYPTEHYCDSIAPKLDEIISHNISINLGYNYVYISVIYHNGWSDIPLKVFVNSNDCPPAKAGPQCAFKAITASLSDPMVFQNPSPEPLFIFYPAASSHATYATTFKLDCLNHGWDGATLGLSTSHVSVIGETDVTISEEETTFTEYAPSFSLTTDVNAGQYWVATLSNADSVTLTASLQYCNSSSNLTLANAASDRETCNETPISLDNMTPNVAQKYEGEGDVYFTIKNAENLKIAMSGNAIAPTLYFDGLRTGLKSWNNFFSIDQYLVKWYSTILGTRFTKNEPLYVWTFTNEEHMCPSGCGGFCEPGQTLCKCTNGELSVQCT